MLVMIASCCDELVHDPRLLPKWSAVEALCSVLLVGDEELARNSVTR